MSFRIKATWLRTSAGTGVDSSLMQLIMQKLIEIVCGEAYT